MELVLVFPYKFKVSMQANNILMLCARFNNKVKLGHDMSKQNCEGNL